MIAPLSGPEGGIRHFAQSSKKNLGGALDMLVKILVPIAIVLDAVDAVGNAFRSAGKKVNTLAEGIFKPKSSPTCVLK
jgi:hypothetical protein